MSLTSSELRDPVKVAQTQTILQRISHGPTWLVLLGLGAVSVQASGYGLLTTSQIPNSPTQPMGNGE